MIHPQPTSESVARQLGALLLVTSLAVAGACTAPDGSDAKRPATPPARPPATPTGEQQQPPPAAGGIRPADDAQDQGEQHDPADEAWADDEWADDEWSDDDWEEEDEDVGRSFLFTVLVLSGFDSPDGVRGIPEGNDSKKHFDLSPRPPGNSIGVDYIATFTPASPVNAEWLPDWLPLEAVDLHPRVIAS